ncbi:thioredoxin-like protein [Glomus cerebriforme]|uniref:Thioredoxin n=1 Tax=Glomus cerebriforme TaxID=658196 RepID=A0A397SNI4_9GLOM|nr:thioredoxin-like protein [Glomus cerebriforme]
MVLAIKDKSTFDSKISENELVVVDFSAVWCGPCKAIAPEFEKLSEIYSNVTFLKVDGDENPELTKEYEISAYPTFLFFKGGKQEVDRKVIGASKSKLEEALKNLTQ